MEWLGVIVVFGVIFGLVALRGYIGRRAEQDRAAREARRGDGTLR